MEDEKKETETPKNNEEAGQDESPKISKEELADLKKKAELADNYKVRAEKAEKKAKERSEEKTTEVSMSPKDYLALTENKITSEDFDVVTDWAKFRNVPISEAIKDKTLKTILNERSEERKTAEITNTKGGQRGVVTPTLGDLESRFEKGALPESDIETLTNARMAERMKGIK